MHAIRQTLLWPLFLGLCVFVHICLAQRQGKQTEAEEESAVGLRMEQGRQIVDEHEAQLLNRSSCMFTFHIPLPESLCTPVTQASLPASQEDLDHLKILVADTGEVLKTLHEAAVLEVGKSRYQDLISEALPDVREANVAFHEALGKFLQDLEDHTEVSHQSHMEDEKKKLKEHLRMMDHMLRVTNHLAQELDQMSQNVLETLTKPLEKTTVLMSGSPLRPF
ncbi:uncharacterized protein LOC121921232 isoform X2 [Sceloporus undulatus]|uniref:uncharacterized protein LOC121921232 isoform X2 n=1 Tax=Sceloporus undulatus TaxID=8520 RepID=UPI001C4B81AB|nr:uncharacterized protein LOC121921232 isoform X2 [Sceloporus undulatus]